MKYFILSIILSLQVISFAQHPSNHSLPALTIISGVEPQPLLAQAIRLSEALSFLGSSLSKEDVKRLKELQQKPLSQETSKLIQNILNPYCLAMIDINPEARVKVLRGPAGAKLIQGGWTSFLVKVHNQAGITAELKAESSNAAPLLHMATYPEQPHALKENLLTTGEVANRFLEILMYHNRPLSPNLSGLALEYAVVQIYSKDAGQRGVEIGFNIGQGTQDIGFRNAINILFTIHPGVKVMLLVKDDDDSPTMASFVITDGVERIIDNTVKAINRSAIDYRLTTAQLENWEPWFPFADYKVPPRLTGIYPLPSRRLAANDEYPDFFFQPQVYRSDGEHVLLPAGRYKVVFTRGPEYITQTKELVVPQGIDSMEATFKLKRWINMADLGWYSADHHIHAAGCSHYESPEEGVKPVDIWRQVLGEDINVAAVLAWGPGWYHQKDFFTGDISPLSTKNNVMRYDVEVSAFPSSHAGHVVLLNLKEDDFPGTTKIEDWPSWTLPVLNWAKSQGAVTGYAHSGFGLQPINEEAMDVSFAVKRNFQLPDYATPKMDGIGANEYIVTVTQDAVDFYSLGNTPAPWELNMWYHTLNCGFRPRISGETDYPCMYDDRVGVARSYFKPDGDLSFNSFIEAIKKGRCYVSDGMSHIINFSVNGLEVGTNNSELSLNGPRNVKIISRVAALLPEQQDEDGAMIAKKPLDRQPYWNIERARIGTTRKVRVELIVNGEAADTTEIFADGKWQDVSFNYPIKQSGWVAIRVYPACHTNPVFVLMNEEPIRVLKSAEWCRQAVDQCWKMKQNNIRFEERTAAEAAYDKARKIYDKIIQESQNE